MPVQAMDMCKRQGQRFRQSTVRFCEGQEDLFFFRRSHEELEPVLSELVVEHLDIFSQTTTHEVSEEVGRVQHWGIEGFAQCSC